MNNNWYLYRNFVRPVLVKAAAVLLTACILSTLYWTVYHILNTKGNLLAAVMGCALGAVLGCLIGFPLVFIGGSIWVMMRIHRLRGRGTGGGSVYRIYKGDGGESRKEDRVLCGIREG